VGTVTIVEQGDHVKVETSVAPWGVLIRYIVGLWESSSLGPGNHYRRALGIITMVERNCPVKVETLIPHTGTCLTAFSDELWEPSLFAEGNYRVKV
jgi:hypothetical protein